jgi:hypothetical protein
MAKPPKPAQLTAGQEATFVYDGAGDIYRPLRLIRDRYERRGDHRSARRVGQLIPNRYEEAAMEAEYLSDADMDFAHDALDRAFGIA